MTERNTRGSIVFAGSFDEEFISSVDQPVRRVYSLFDAIGELATCCSSDLVDAIVVDEDLLQEQSSNHIDALRRVDPTAIIIVSGSGDRVKHADGSIPKDSTAAKLSSEISSVKSKPDCEDPYYELDLDEVLGISDGAKIVKESSHLGVIDLVRALIHAPASFKDVLIDLLKQQTGWSFCAIIDDRASAPEGASVASLRYGHEEHGLLVAIGSNDSELTRLSRWAACWLDLAHRQQKLKLLAYKDDLSGAWNRRFLRTCFARELQIARDTRRPLTIMIFDIDNFKHYNDCWGHDAGDEIIREIVRLLRTIIRRGDHVCRIGGDEFAVLFCDPEPPREPGSNHPTNVKMLAKRFQEQVSNARFPKLGEEATGVLSISGGLATFPWDSSDLDELLKKADQRLFQSKRDGKNSINIGNKG